MRRTHALSLTLLLATSAYAQAPPQPVPPVEQTEAPEDKATDPEREPDPLPNPAPAPRRPPAAAGSPPAQRSRAAEPSRRSGTSTRPPGARIRQVPINVDEGSWMDVDVSPDGRTIAFDLLGDIYTMPIAGGTPTRIAEGLAWEVQPRFSPDGTRIAFTSDRGGGDNIWLMNADGSDKRQLTKEEFRLLNQPTLEPGRALHRRQEAFHHRPLARHRRGLALPRVGRRRRAAGQARRTSSTRRSSASRSSRPTARRSITRATSRPGPIFQYAQDSNTDLFHIERYDLETGEVTTAVSGPGGSVRPTPSPDGKKIAFVRRERDQVEALRQGPRLGRRAQALRRARPGRAGDLGGHRRLSEHGLDARQPKHRLLGRRQDPPGRCRRRRRRARSRSASTTRAASSTRRIRRSRSRPERFTTKMPRFAEVSPDGRQVVFESLGKLWLKPMAGGSAAAPDQRQERQLRAVPVLVARRQDDRLRRLDRRRPGPHDARSARAAATPRDVTSQPGHYARPRFSPDGRTIVFETRQRRRPHLADLVRQSGRLSRRRRAAARRCASPRTRPPRSFGAASDRLFMIGAEGRQEAAGQHRPQRRGAARPCQRRAGQRLRRLARRPARRLPPELRGVRDAADAGRAGGRSRAKEAAAAGDQGQRWRRRLYPLVAATANGCTGASARRSTRRVADACSPAAPAGRRRAQVRAADDRRVAGDGRGRRQADAAPSR